MTFCSVDFETRSSLDLRKTSVHKYASHPDTDFWCMAWAIGDEDVHLWAPGRPVPEALAAHVESGGVMRAWNAQFERVMWRDLLGPRYGFSVPTMEQWFCTQAEAKAMALPRSLGMCADVLNLDVQKDSEGRRLMLQMAKPRKPRKDEPDDALLWWDDTPRRRKLLLYCRQDVVVEREIAKFMRPLSDTERSVYLMDQRINDRGVMLDVPLVKGCIAVVDRAKEDANAELARLTDGAVDKVTQNAKMTAWLDEVSKHDIDNIRKSTVRDLLELDDLDERVRLVLTLRQETGKASVSKLDAMLNYCEDDDRVRALLNYHAASTGRWAGLGVQPQNFPRPDIDDVERYIPAILEGNYGALDEPPIQIVASLLRGCFRASPGHRLIAADFSQIEARVLGWIAGEPYGEKEYEKMGAAYSGKPLDEITKDSLERQIGKGAVLGCGYQMGADKFQTQIYEQTGIELSDEDARKVVRTYRDSKPGIPAFWKEIEAAAMRAVWHPGEVTTCGLDDKIQYVVRGQFLWCILPSKRPLAYALPRIKERKTKWGMKLGLQYMGMNSYTRKWGVQHAYGGLLTENVVQAMARDIMAERMLVLEDDGYPLVLSVHDEIVADVPDGHGSLDDFVETMTTVPSWAAGCPIAGEGWEGERYRK